MRGQSAESRLFVLPHEAAIAEDVGTDYRGELTFHDLTPGRIADSSLQAGLTTVVTDEFFVSFVLLRNPFKQRLQRELRVNPQKFRRFLPRLLIAAPLGIVNDQLSVGTEVMREAGDVQLEDGNRFRISPHLSVGPGLDKQVIGPSLRVV